MKGEFYKYGGVIDYTAKEDVGYHDVVKIGDIVGIASHSAKAGETIACEVEGVYTFPKTASEKIDAGAKVYMVSDKVSATQGTDGTALGVAWNDATADDAEVKVRINF